MAGGYAVERLSARYDYSLGAVERLVAVYGEERAERILESLKSPGRRYFLRVNTLRADRDEVVLLLRREGLSASPCTILPDAVYLPVEGPFKVERRGKTVVADKAAAEAVYMGANLYAPGVLRADGVREGDPVNVVSPRGHVVGEGIAMMDSAEMMSVERGLAVKTTLSVYRVPSVRGLDVYERGLVYDQSLPAMMAGHILDPKPGWVIVDMCAAPGGKATHVAQLTLDEAKIIAVDRSKPKCNRIRENAERLGIKSIEVRVGDSRMVETFHDVAGDVDAVILDPPCSAIGVRPSLYYDRGEDALLSLSRYQRQFMETAFRILRRGGLLLYSTCTLTLEENEANVKWAVDELGFKLRELALAIGSPGLLRLGKRAVRFEPDAHDTPGFFIALLEKP